MKMKKIVLIQLPAAVEQALTERLSGCEIAAFKKPPPDLAQRQPDLIVTDAEQAAVAAPGFPVLSLSFAQPLRLGVLLRQIGQVLAQPMLYASDMALGGGIFHPQERLLARGDEEISLTDRESDMLVYLARRGGTAVSRDELLKNVWQYQEGVDTHTLETHIYRLRQKIEASADAPRILVTVEGGYALNTDTGE